MTESIESLSEAINDNFSEGDEMRFRSHRSLSIKSIGDFPGNEYIIVEVSPDEYTAESGSGGCTPVDVDGTHLITLGGETFKARLSRIFFGDGLYLEFSIIDEISDLDRRSQRVLKFLYENQQSVFEETRITDHIYGDRPQPPYNPIAREPHPDAGAGPPFDFDPDPDVQDELKQLHDNDLIYNRDTHPTTWGISADGIDFVSTDRRFSEPMRGEESGVADAEVDQ